MEILQTSLGWFAAIFMVGIILFIHESGHYIMAVLNGVSIEEFGFGFPPRLLQLFKWRGTIFSLNWIPFGAYVRPAGEDDPSIAGGLAAASKRVRAMVMLGGVSANLIVGILAFTIVAKIAYPDPSVVLIQQVEAGSPAAIAGFVPGDRILAVDALPVSDASALIKYIHSHLGQDVAMDVQRGAESLTLHVIPRTEPVANQGPTGVVLAIGYSNTHSWWDAVSLAMRMIGEYFLALVRLPMMLIQGQISLAQGRPIGPIGLVDVSEQVIVSAAQQNQWVMVLNWLGLVNIALAIGNLLPIPAVDGGRLLFVFWEAIRGKRMNPNVERSLIAGTMMFLLACLGVLTLLDIFFPVLPR
jgi:regulator of sigma E protease